MSSGHRFRDVYLILLCGLPGTGKSTVAKRLCEYLKNYTLIDQNKIRRKCGYKKMPKTFDHVLREIDRLTAENLNSGRGVIFDSVNRRTSRRQQMYGVASCCNSRVVTLEIVCSEDVAKHRIATRPKGDGFLSDPNDTAVYDRLKNDSDAVDMDFLHPGQDHVSHIQFDSEQNQLVRKIVRKGTSRFISEIEKALVA